MKHIRALILGTLVFSAGFQASAQILDGLFEDEDFQSSEIDKMQKEVSAKNAAEKQQKTIQKPSPSVVSSPDVSSMAAQPSVSGSGEKPVLKTFSLPVKQQAIQSAPSLPTIGSGRMQAMPKLGANAKNDENLSLFEMRARKKGTSNTNVLNFDIAGIRLKMTPQEVVEKAKEAGFSVKFKDWKIPEIKEWKYHRECLQRMFFAYDSKKSCIRENARKDNNEYVRRLVFENKQRHETLSVEFTSGLTQNQAYRIRYVSKGDHSLGSTEEARYLKTRRRREFLELLIKKYGPPDDERALLWGISGLNAVLQAEISGTFQDISLVMEDPSMDESDFDAVSSEDTKTDSLNNFSF